MTLTEIASGSALKAISLIIELRVAVRKGRGGAFAIIESEACIAARAKSIISIISIAVDVHCLTEAFRVNEGSCCAGGADSL